MSKRERLGENNPLMDFIEGKPTAAPKGKGRKSTVAQLAKPAIDEKPAKQALKAKPAKKAITVRLPVELLERIRDVAVFSPRVTIDSLAAQGFRLVIAALEKEYEKQNGKPLPRREPEWEVRRGRPVK